MSIDGGSNYNVTKTTTSFRAGNYENDSSTAFAYLDSDDFGWQANTASETGYNETVTSTAFTPYHQEDGGSGQVAYNSSLYSAQSTSFIDLGGDTNNDNDGSLSGTMHLFNPSNTTFVKHFTARSSVYNHNPMSVDAFVSGYFNTTSAIDGVQFAMSSGNIDSGTIKLYGIKGS